MNFSSKPINIPNKNFRYERPLPLSENELDKIGFSPPELRDRIETISWKDYLADRIEKIPFSRSLPNIKIEKK